MKIAVVGSGIAGIGAAHFLQQQHDVTLFEAGPAIGGHANPLQINNGLEPPFDVDTGFLIFNLKSYPLFMRFIHDLLDVPATVQVADMSFSFVDHNKNLMFAISRGFGGYFYQKKNLFSRSFYRMFSDWLRFRKSAYQDLMADRIGTQSLKEYLADYSELFRENIIAPMAAAVWSLPPTYIWEFPAETYIRFQHNHNYLTGNDFMKPHWLTFRQSSRVYLDAFKARFKGEIRLNSPIQQIHRSEQKVTLHLHASEETFDKIVIATHADTAVSLLAEPSKMEQELLGQWHYHGSLATVHQESALLPPSRKLWASWNLRTEGLHHQITYHLNSLQALPTQQDYFLTLGPVDLPPDKILYQCTYHHPVYGAAAVVTQKELPQLNGHQNTYYCGSYFGYGFHEDALKSALAVAEALGVNE